MPSINVTDDAVKYLIAIGVLDAAGGMKSQTVQAKVLAYTIVPATDPSDSTFTNRAAAASVTFTLPAAAAALRGVRYRFVGVAGFAIVVAAAAGTVVTFNNAAATSVAASTAGQLIGAEIEAECDGTSWLVNGRTPGVTYTVA